MKHTFLLLFVFCTLTSIAQERRFEASALLGLNASQIAGDFLLGFNKIGLVVGGRMSVLINPKRRLVLEMLYSQRGSRSTIKVTQYPIFVRTNYIEVPLYYQFNHWLNDDPKGAYYRLHLISGLSYGHLLSASADVEHKQPIAQVVDEFKPFDLSAVLGASLQTSRHFGISFRYTRGILPLYNPGKHNQGLNDPKVRSLYAYHLSVLLNYYF